MRTFPKKASAACCASRREVRPRVWAVPGEASSPPSSFSRDLELFEKRQPDVVLYDVLGDVVCGGFAAPIREGYASKVLIVTSGEKMALYAANNINTAVKNFEDRSYAKVYGIVLNPPQRGK